MSDRNIEKWLAMAKEGKVLPERDLRILCEKVKEILIEESNIQPVSSPVTICGDIHGQFHDLLQLFSKGGEIPSMKYIFLGDFVDRGYHSIETFVYLMCLKCRYPDHITLIRGNHETRQISNLYGFYEECVRKYGNSNAWKYCNEVFDYLVFGAVVDEKIFCIHGGLSPEVKTID